MKKNNFIKIVYVLIIFVLIFNTLSIATPFPQSEPPIKFQVEQGVHYLREILSWIMLILVYPTLIITLFIDKIIFNKKQTKGKNNKVFKITYIICLWVSITYSVLMTIMDCILTICNEPVGYY